MTAWPRLAVMVLALPLLALPFGRQALSADAPVTFDLVNSTWTVAADGSDVVEAEVTLRLPKTGTMRVAQVPLTWSGSTETLEVLEFASLPQTPTEPKRPIIVLAATGIGLILGLFMAGAREVKDSSLKNLKDVRAYTQLPILGSIPLLENDLIVRRRRRLGWLAWATACLVGVIVMGTSIVYYYTSIRTGV